MYCWESLMLNLSLRGSHVLFCTVLYSPVLYGEQFSAAFAIFKHIRYKWLHVCRKMKRSLTYVSEKLFYAYLLNALQPGWIFLFLNCHPN